MNLSPLSVGNIAHDPIQDHMELILAPHYISKKNVRQDPCSSWVKQFRGPRLLIVNQNPQ